MNDRNISGSKGNEPQNSNENQISITPAPLWKRFMAMLYDFFLIVALSMAYGGLVTAINAFNTEAQTQNYQPTVSGLEFQLGWLSVIFSFYCFFWLKAGQTVGMKAWRLKIVSNNDKPLTFWQCLLRFIGAVLSFAVAGLGFFWAIIDPKKATLHDKLSLSRVVITPKLAKSSKI